MSTLDRTVNQGEKPKLYGKAQTLHLLLWIAGIVYALGTFAIIMVPFMRDAEHQVTSDEAPLLIVIGIVVGMISALSIFAAILLRAGNPRAKTFALVAGILLLPFMPLGTAIGVGILITRASADTTQYLVAANAYRQSTSST